MRTAARALLLLLIAILAASAASGPGFRTAKLLDDHYRKHGHEFGNITKDDYLRLAQELRDAPPGGAILKADRADGVTTKFDRKRGYFGAYNPDRTIRTFFIPAAGESYFQRQARRPARR